MMRNPGQRSVLAAGAALAAAAAAPTAFAKTADLIGPAPLTLFDPAAPAARAYAETAASRGGRSVPIEGDRIRLARRLFAQGAPARITVIARHADVLLLAEAAREEGYRSVTADRAAVVDGHSGLFVWAAQRTL